MSDMLPKLFFAHFRPTSFVAECDGNIVGFIVGFVSQTSSEEAYIHFVGVHVDFRNGGLGRTLYLIIDASGAVTVGNIEVAQFLSLLLDNRKIRDVIDTTTSKVVLILGRFTPERKAILEAIRTELGRRNYVPVRFDFEEPASRDLTETISTLAHISRFVIADITSAKSIPQELMAIVPNLPSVPVQPLGFPPRNIGFLAAFTATSLGHMQFPGFYSTAASPDRTAHVRHIL